MIAWLFPGQDAFTPELGLSLLDRPLGASLIAHAEQCTGVPLSTPASRRRAGTFDTAIIQPLLAAVAMTLAADRPLPDVVAGASLGALLAYAVATGQDPASVVTAAALRGRAMADAARRWPGGMIAVAEADVPAALARGATVGVLDRAAQNVDGQWILAGDAAALRAVGPLGRPVPVTGPWHCARMADAEPAVAEALAALPDHPPRCSWIVDGRSGERADLVTLTRPVLWRDTLLRLRGAEQVWVLGPSKVLRAQVRDVLGLEAREMT